MFYIQLIAIIAFCIWILAYYRKTVRDILIFQSAANILYFIHYLLLGALSGAYISFVGIVRNLLFLLFKKNKKILVIILIVLYFIITVMFYENLYSIIPMCACSIYLLFMLKDNKISLLEGEFICALLWLVYGIFVHSYSSVITEGILCISCMVQIIKIKKQLN